MLLYEEKLVWGNVNMTEKKLTGYPHIDRPWMQFYDPDADKIVIPNMNLTEYVKGKNVDRGSLIAESYYGKKTTFDEFFYNVDLASKVLSQIGINKGDIIMNLVPNIPESSRIWHGAIQLGAISDFIDPRPDSMDIMANAKKVLEVIKYERANYIVALDKCYLGMLKPIEKELKELGINTIILLSATDSMNLSGKIDYLKDVLNYNNLKNIKNTDANVKKLKSYQVLAEKLKMMQKEGKLLEEAIKTSPLQVVKYSDLIRDCANSSFDKVSDVELVNYIGHTSGTSSSRPKPITATNKNGISTLEQLIKGKVSFDAGDVALNVLPLFAPFGAYDNNLLNLVSGAANIYVPEFEISEFGYLVKKYRPNIIMGTPAWLAALPNYGYLEGLDLSCIKKIIYGGDSMSPEDEENLNRWLKLHGSNAVAEKGHGMSEFLGCGSYAQKGYNMLGSIGIPLPNTIYTIVDPNVEEKLVPLKFENGKDILSGELVVSSDAITPGTLHGDIIVPKYDMDGRSYIRTRDLAHMDKNGVFYHEARKDRSFTRFDGFKIKPYEIEKEILKNENVKYACLVDYFDDKRRGIMPICHIVLEQEDYSEETMIEVVKEIIYKNIIGNPDMSSRQIPAKFKIRTDLPISKNGKVDFNALRREELTGDEVNVDVNETNLTVDTIDIYINKKNAKVKVRK